MFALDVAKQLQAYEVEYHVLQEEMMNSPQRGDNDVIDKLETANHKLKSQNMELLEQLQHAHSNNRSLEVMIHNIQTNQNKLKSHIRTLELERAALLNAVSKLRKLVPPEVLKAADINLPAIQADVTIANAPLHNPGLAQRVQREGLHGLSSGDNLDEEVEGLTTTTAATARHRNKNDKTRPSPVNGASSLKDSNKERPASNYY